jgi:transcriptional regulator with XRE-family HTH domain
MLANLKILRDEASVSQKQLAEAIGVSQQSINKYENHNIEPDIETMIRIADFFNTSVDYLIGHTEVRRKIEVVHAYELNADEVKIVDGYRNLSAKQKNCVTTVIDSYQY